MSANPPSDPVEAMGPVAVAVANALAEQKPKRKIAAQLMRAGRTEAEANQFIQDVEQAMNAYWETPEGKRLKAANYTLHLILGPVLIAIGALITYISFSLTAPGGTFVVAYGAMLAGLVDFIYGLAGHIKRKTA
jgi:hypothetical protein